MQWSRCLTVAAMVVVAVVGCESGQSSTESKVASSLTATTDGVAPMSPSTIVALPSTTLAVATATEPPTTDPATTSTVGVQTATTTMPAYESVLADGMSCEDFAVVDLGWFAALGYWFVNGRPSYLDSDGDGLPCEDVVFPIIEEDGTEGTIVWGENLWIHLYRSGMYCRDLVAEEGRPPFWAAVLYWIEEGEPARMDADRDGVPCETVYPDVLIREFLEDPYLDAHGWRMVTEDFGPGMLCRELVWWRPFHLQALAYFYAEGFPSRMDADGNGIPCESVYDEDDLSGAVSYAEGLGPGLTCHALADEVRLYRTTAVYWLVHNRPNDLDPDGDGYPCSPGWPRPDEVDYFKEGSPGCCAG